MSRVPGSVHLTECVQVALHYLGLGRAGATSYSTVSCSEGLPSQEEAARLCEGQTKMPLRCGYLAPGKWKWNQNKGNQKNKRERARERDHWDTRNSIFNSASVSFHSSNYVLPYFFIGLLQPSYTEHTFPRMVLQLILFTCDLPVLPVATRITSISLLVF